MTFSYETKKLANGAKVVIGCDEVGRGCLAGPVVAAAVVLLPKNVSHKDVKLHEVRDSKLLTPKKREQLSSFIKHFSLWSVGEVSSGVVDDINIHNATLLAMRRAIEGLKSSLHSASGSSGKCFVAVDGRFTIPNLNFSQEAIVGGDHKVISIAAASIIAKVYRDKLMRNIAGKYPLYGFEKHKGYATLEHRQAVRKHGLSPIHRKSFCSHYI